MTYVETILARESDPTSAALEIHCVVEQVDESARTPSERVVAEIMRLAGQVANGGFDQYFFNSGVWSAHAAAAALEKVGAKNVATILRTAMEVIRLPEPVPDDFKYEPLQQALNALGRLDDEFYKSDEGLYARVTEFAAANSADFGFGDSV